MTAAELDALLRRKAKPGTPIRRGREVSSRPRLLPRLREHRSARLPRLRRHRLPRQMETLVNPVPKPPRSLPKPRKQIARSRVRKSNPKRRKSEFVRCYGSKQRVEFVNALGCICRTTRCLGQKVDNHHIRTDGMRRKAGYDQIVPLCRFHHILLHNTTMHRTAFENCFGLDLAQCARDTEQAWQAFSKEGE